MSLDVPTNSLAPRILVPTTVSIAEKKIGSKLCSGLRTTWVPITFLNWSEAPHLANAVQVAAVGGRIYQIGALQGFDVTAPAMPLMLKDVTIHGIATGHRRALEDLVNAVDLAGLKSVIDTSYPFDALSAALDHLGGSAFGKIILEIE